MHNDLVNSLGVCYTGPGMLEVLARPVKHRSGNVLIRVAYAGICGTDIAILSGKHPRAKPPLTLGHEISGVVEEVGAGADRFTIGQKVSVFPLAACGSCHPCSTGNPHVCEQLRLVGIDFDGGMAKYLSVPADVVHTLREEVPLDVAALVEPVAVAIHAVRESGVRILDSVIVCGAGPIGILTAIVLREAGIESPLIIEIDEGRRVFCEELGFKTVDPTRGDINHLLASSKGSAPADVLFEVSGAEKAAINMTRLVRPRGTIVVVSVFKNPTPIALRDINFAELRLVGSRVYSQSEFALACDVVHRRADILKRLISHRFSLGDAASAFEVAQSPASSPLKVLVHCR